MDTDLSKPLVAVCMATYNPPPDLFRAQLESIVGQTHRNWLCVISDDCSDEQFFREILAAASRDPRFVVKRGERRLGFYRNFERALRLAPREADFVALADHDDLWYPQKLAACLEAFRPRVRLVYSDMEIVARDGAPIHATYWTTRRNNFTDLETLLFANTVTGAASIFRAEMLEELLPFPDLPGRPFHDHWIACVALAGGELAYVDRALYAYRQHEGNVIGHVPGPPIRALSEAKALAFQLYSSLAPWKPADAFAPALRGAYLDSVVRLSALAKVLLSRAKGLTPEKRAVLERFSGFERSLPSLCVQAAKYLFTRRPTLGVELLALRAAVGMRLFKIYRRLARD